MILLKVEAYSGYRADERPLRFLLGEQWRRVTEIVDRWYGPQDQYFRVKADDGNLYILRLEEATEQWSLAGYRSGPE